MPKMPMSYYSPLLPVIVDEPGNYMTRAGEVVHIYQTGKSATYALNFGNYPNGVDESWHQSGRIFCGRECNNDIIGKA